MKFNLSDFKKVRHDKNTTTLQHKDGHQLTIAHQPLHPKLREALASLPVHDSAAGGEHVETKPEPHASAKPKKALGSKMMAKGGDVPHYAHGSPDGISNDVIDYSKIEGNDLPYGVKEAREQIAAEGAPPASKQALTSDQLNNVVDLANAADKDQKIADATQAPPGGVGPTMPQSVAAAVTAAPTPKTLDVPELGPQQPAQQAAEMPAEAAPQKPAGPVDYRNMSQEELLHATEPATAAAEALQGNKMVNDAALAAAHKAKEPLLAAAAEHEAYMSSVKGQMERLQKQVNDVVTHAQIDPNRVWHDTSTAGKIGVGIGLLLSGLGSGLSGQSNMAMDFINKQIDRDIDAQKSTSNNLLHAATLQMGNIQQGAQLAKLTYQSMVSAELDKAAINTQDQRLKGLALQQSAQIKQNVFDGMLRLSIYRDGASGPVANNPDQAARKAAIQIPYIIPKEHQAEAFKELNEYQGLEKIREQIHGAQDAIAKMPLGGIMSPIQRKAYLSALSGLLQKDVEGRFNQSAVQNIMAGLARPIGMPLNKDTLRVQQQEVDKLIDSMVAGKTAILRSSPAIRLPMSSQDRMSPEQRTHMDWAKNNLNNNQIVTDSKGNKYKASDVAAAALKRFGM